MLKKGVLTYLASPYNDPDPRIKERRYQKICQLAANLIKEGYHIFSPISHNCTLIYQDEELKNGWDLWSRYDELLLNQCEQLLVAKMEGWTRSQGVSAEIAMAKALKMPIYALELLSESEATFEIALLGGK